MRELSGHPELGAINTATLGFQAPIEQVIDAIARAGFGGIAPWRREVEGHDVRAIGKRIRDAGLKVTGYCRSTYFSAETRSDFLANIAANMKALEDAAIVGAHHFTLVVGSGKNLEKARTQVVDGIGMLLDHADQCGVKLALEPLHPVYAADRSCINTLEHALDICDGFENDVLGVVVDVYHVWWDANIGAQLRRAQKRIIGFHVSDWLNPTIDILNDRGMMGDGVIPIKQLRGLVEDAGYRGLIECEIFSSENWSKRPMVETLRIIKERFATAV